jgi:hypothetical protein
MMWVKVGLPRHLGILTSLLTTGLSGELGQEVSLRDLPRKVLVGHE